MFKYDSLWNYIIEKIGSRAPITTNIIWEVKRDIRQRFV